MSDLFVMKSETVLITEASSGIGLHLAHDFAKHGHPLVLVAPVESELRNLAAEFDREHSIAVRVIAKDLRREKSAQEISMKSSKAASRWKSWLTMRDTDSLESFRGNPYASKYS